MTIDWAKTDASILTAAMEQLGLKHIGGEQFKSIHSGQQVTRPELTFGGYQNGVWTAAVLRDGKLTIASANPADTERAIRRAYGEQTVRAAAKRFGWNVQQDAQNQQKFAIRRRA
jgi:hypothetical protein